MHTELHAALARQKEEAIARRARSTRPTVRTLSADPGRRTRSLLRARFDG